MSATIRDLAPDDACAVAAIYNDAVAKRLATFDVKPTSVTEMKTDLRSSLPTHPGIAVEMDGHAQLDGAWRDVVIIEKRLEQS